MVLVDDPHNCEIMVTRDPSKLGEIDAFIMSLKGGLVASAEFLASGGQRGPSIFYHAATRTPRRLWISTGFSTANACLANHIRRAVNDSKWKLLLNDTEFMLWVEKLEPQKRLMEVIGVVSDREKAIAGLNEMRNVFTKFDFLRFCQRLDMARSTIGACGL